jgi:putative aminopeptidase FrvX
VAETREITRGQTRRRRVCLTVTCGKKFTTVELVVGADRKYKHGDVAMISRRDLETIAKLAHVALEQTPRQETNGT